VLGRCGHAPPLEQPSAFRELLAGFLAADLTG
jgi:pimeloyl-ACP methyl ester carboxylesterase